MSTDSTYFTPFKASIDHIELPKRFTYPFCYEPHPISLIAAEELQAHIQSMGWDSIFGADGDQNESTLGKMFGVMVVQRENGDLGYLSAFSGKIDESNTHTGFIPPVFDMLEPNGFFVKEMGELMEFNKKGNALIEDPELKQRKQNYEHLQKQSREEIEAHRKKMREAKAERKIKRMEGEIEMTGDAFRILEKELSKESLMYKHQLKELTRNWEGKISQAKKSYRELADQVDTFKSKRKQMSNTLQQKLFDQYNFLNQDGELKNVRDIFKDTVLKVPPSGAGECAAPKLLQFAYQHKLKPIAMAEFWWGKAPKSEIRKHKSFYPSCKGKCEPILGHMLKGVDVEDNPLLIVPDSLKAPEIVFEDDHILILNKPEGMLSVRGKTALPSIQEFAEQNYPKADRPMIIHRLDMGTSGILILSKTCEANKHIQSQFIKRSMKKRYVAVLEGNIEKDEGTIDLPMKQDFIDRPKQMVCHKEGKPALTEFKVIERSNNRTKVHFFPITGRSHQLRVHAAHIDGLNTPIVGDDLYGKRGTRLHLHAEYIEFNHPITRERLKISVKADF